MENLTSFKDADLARRVKSGEKNAYQLLFEKYAPKIYHFSLSYIGNESDSEELVQDVFLKLWEKREILDSTKNIKAYIFKIAINAIYDFVRRKNITNAFNDFVKNSYDPQLNDTWDTVVFNDLKDSIDKLIARMPEQRRRVFHLSRIKGLSNDEIAQKLNISKRNVENQLYRTIKYLKEHYANESLISLLFFYIYYN